MSSLEGSPVRKRSEYQNALRDWNSVSRHDGVSRAGNNWILQALDTFHDTPFQATDMPDGVNGREIVHVVTQEISFGKPADLAAGAVWDLHVCTNGVAGGTNGIAGFATTLSDSSVQLGADHSYLGSTIAINPSGSRYIPPAPVIMWRGVNGAESFLNPTAASLSIGAMDIPAQYLTGPCRVVGMAFELVNTTPALYVNGQCTAYRVPSRYVPGTAEVRGIIPIGSTVYDSDMTFATATTAKNYTNSAEFWYGAYAPTTLSLAALSPDSLLWHAKEGAYVNAVFEQPPTLEFPKPFLHGWLSGDPATGSDVIAHAYSMNPLHFNTASTVLSRGAGMTGTTAATLDGVPTNSYYYRAMYPRMIKVPVARSGVYMTGLNENTTFTLRVRFIIARVPSINEGQIFVLARTPPTQDHEFWKLYTEAVQHLPVACMFTENPLGEWFGKVLKVVKDWAPTVGSAVGTIIPGASALGQGIGYAAGLGKKMIKASGGDGKAAKKIQEIEGSSKKPKDKK